MDPLENRNQPNVNELPEPVVFSPTQPPQAQPSQPGEALPPANPQFVQNTPQFPRTLNSPPVSQADHNSAIGAGQIVSGDFGATPPVQPQVHVAPSDTWAGISGNPQNTAYPQPNVVTSQPLSGQPPAIPPANPKKSFFKRKAFLLPLIILLLIVIGGAAVYAEVILPNKPANVLKAGFINTIQEKKFSFDATGNFDPTSSTSGIAAKVIAKGSLDTVNQTSDTNLSITVTGVNINLEVRYVDQNIYIKTGDLTTLAALINNFAPSDASQYSLVAKQLSNQWIEVDSTLLKQAGLSCVIDNSNDNLSSSDIKLLENAYAQNPFAAITSSSADVINGAAAEKFVININDNSGAKFLNSFTGLSTAKSVSSCESKQSLKTTALKGDNKTVPLTVWVDKSTKRIVQIGFTPTPQEVTQSGEKGSIVVGLGYNPAPVSAPSGAKPALTVLTEVEQDLGLSSTGATTPNLSNLFSGLNTSTPSDSILQ